MIGRENRRIVFQHSPCVSAVGWNKPFNPMGFEFVVILTFKVLSLILSVLPVRSLSCLKRISTQNTLSAKHIYNCFRSFCPACFFNVFHSFCSPFLSILPIQKRSAAARFPCAAAFALPAKRRSVFSGKNMEFPLSGLTFSRILHIITVSQKQYGRGVPVPRG